MAEEEAQHLFVYGNLRPDSHAGKECLQLRSTKKAWLLGGRLYCVVRDGGRKQAAVRLDEPGNAVKGYVVSTQDPGELSSLMNKCEDVEHRGYDRDVVEVITEAGERVSAYVYHCPQVDQSKPVENGDWIGCV